MPVDTCPSDADWGRWSGGLLEDHLSAEFDAHLVECAACLDRVRNAPAPDRLVLSLKALGPDEELSQGERFSIARIVEKIKLRKSESSVFDPVTGVLPKSDETLRGDAATSAVGREGGGGVPGGPNDVVPPATGSVQLEPVSRAENGPREPTAQVTQRDEKLATPTDKELEPGLVLGAYKLVKKLGQGGMGMVFLAEHQRMKRLVALKVLPPTVTRNDMAVQRFQREVQAMARLSHQNIVTAHDADEARGLHFLVMEYVDGQDLSDLVKKRGPLSVEQAVDYIVQAARGLEYAHKRGLVHRDIKPSNLLVDTEGHVKVLDLGLARFSDQADSEGMDLTGTGVVAGTVDYMSPEQATNTKTADARADIYSLGCTLWFLLTGKSVYGGDTVVARLMAHQTEPIPPLRALNPGIPDELDRVYQKMVAKKKEHRYQTMSEVLTDLATIAPASAGVATPRFAPDAPRPMLAEQTIAGPLSDLSRAPSTIASGIAQPPRRGSLVKIAAAGAFALVLLFGVWIVLKDKDGKELARIEVKPGSPVTLNPAPGTSVTVENTGVWSGTGTTPPASGGRLTSSATKAVAEDVSLPPSGNTPPKITFDPTPPEPLGTWQAGPEAGWLNADQGYDFAEDPVLPGLIDTPREIAGVKRWNVDSRLPRSAITNIRYSPDGKFVAVGSGDGHTRVFDVVTRELRAFIPGVARQQGVADLDWHPDSRRLAIATGSHGGIVLADINGRFRQVLRNVVQVDVAWNGEGDRLAVNGFSGLHILDTKGDVVQSAGELASGFPGSQWTPEDRTLVAVFNDGKLKEWDIATGKANVLDDVPLIIGHRIAVSGDNWLAVSVGDKVRLYDPDRKMVRELAGPGGPLAWSPDGKRLFGGQFGHIWDRESGEVLARSGAQQRTCDWSPDGQRLISGTGAGLIEYNAAFEQQTTWPLNNFWTEILSWSSDGALLASAPTRFFTDAGIVISAPKISSSIRVPWLGSEVLAIDHNGKVEAFTPQTGKRRSLVGKLLTNASDIVTSPDGRRFAVAREGTVDVFDASGKPLRSLPIGGKGPAQLAWNPTSGKLAVLEEGQPFRFLDPDTGGEPQIASGEPLGPLSAQAPVWSPDGQVLPVFGQGWFDAEGRKLPTPPPATSIFIGSWRADSKEGLWCGGQNAVFRMVDGEGRDSRARPTNGGIVCGNWHPQGHLIATGTTHSTITTWRASDLLPHWTAVSLPDDKTATFSGAGELLNPDPEQVDKHLVYYVEREAGKIELLTPPEFRKLVAAADAASHTPGENTPTGKQEWDTPEFRKWLAEVKGLPAEQLLEAVSKKMVELNPGFHGKFGHDWGHIPGPRVVIERGRVVEIGFMSHLVSNIAPLRAFGTLRAVGCLGSPQGHEPSHLLVDLSPLQGMKIERFGSAFNLSLKDVSPILGPELRELSVVEAAFSDLSPLRRLKLTLLEVSQTHVRDLSPLRGMPLESLRVAGSEVDDLTPLEGMPLKTLVLRGQKKVRDLSPLAAAPLEYFDCFDSGVESVESLRGKPITRLELDGTQVTDLSPLRGMPLKILGISNTRVTDLQPLAGMKLETLQLRECRLLTDLSPVHGMPLRELSLVFDAERDTEWLRGTKTLMYINGQLVEEFWKEADKMSASGNTPSNIALDLTPPKPLGTWTAGTLAAWLTGDFSHDGPVMGGLIDTPRAIPGVKRWNVDTTWTRGRIRVVRFSPDGKWVALACTDGHVRILDAATMKLDRLLPGVGGQGQDIYLDWHPDSQQLAVLGVGQVRILSRDGQSARALSLSPGFRPMRCVWNHAGTRLAFGRDWLRDGGPFAAEIRAADGTLVGQLGPDPTGQLFGQVEGLYWTADDRQVVLRGTGQRCAEFDAESGREVWAAEDLQPSNQLALSLSRDGWLAVGNGESVQLYDDQRKLARTLANVPLGNIAWHPDGKRLMTGQGLFDRDTGKASGGATDFFTSFAWSPEGQRVMGVGDGILAEFTATGEASGRTWGVLQNTNQVFRLRWSPDGARLVGQAFAHLPNERSPELVDADGHALAVTPSLAANALALGTPDGATTFAFGKARSAPETPPALWGIAPDGTARSLWTLTGTSDPLWSIIGSTGGVSPDGRYIALGLNDAVHVLDAAGKPVTRIPAPDSGHPLVAWNPVTGELSIVQANQPLRFADPKQDWKLRAVGEKFPAFSFIQLQSIHWSPDGRWLAIREVGLFDIEGRPAPDNASKTHVATWRADSAEYVWAGGSQLHFSLHAADGGRKRLRSVSGGLYSAAWHPRGHLIATGSFTSVLTAWRTSDLLPHWTKVLLPEDQSATFSGAGELLHPDPAQFDDLLTYTIERDDGSVQNLTPSQFKKFVTEADSRP